MRNGPRAAGDPHTQTVTATGTVRRARVAVLLINSGVLDTTKDVQE